MAFESTKVIVKQNKTIKNEIVEVEKNFNWDFNVDKILSAKAYSKILSKEMHENQLVIEGKTKVDLLVLEDGKTRTCFEEIEWNKTCEASTVGETIVDILDTDTNILNDSGVSVKVQISLRMMAEALDVIPGIIVDDEKIEIKKREIDVVNLIGAVNNTFNITHEIDADLGMDILSKDVLINVTSITSGVDAYMLEGFVDAKLILKREQEYKEIKTTFDFKQELPFAGLLPTHNLFNKQSVTTCIASISENEDKATITLTMDIEDLAIAKTSVNLQTVNDAYCVDNELISSEECVKIIKDEVAQNVSKQQVIAFNNSSLIEEILLVSGARFVNNKIQSGKVNGELVYDIIYRNENGEIESVTRRDEVGFSIDNSDNAELWNSEVRVASARLKFGNEIELTFNIDLQLIIRNEEYITYLTEVSLGEEITDEKPAIEVYVVKEGEDAFDIGKAMRAKLSKLKEQNPNLEEIQPGQHVVIYNKLEK